MKWSSLFGVAKRLQKHKETPTSARRRPFQVVQVEVTSRCFTGCIFCPHNELSDEWQEGDLPFDLYRDCIAPHLADFELVYLQGWGEPMQHPRLWEMLDLAQQHGCRTGFTTNASLLGAEQSARLVEKGVDLISISLAGAGPQMHQALRKNSSWDLVYKNIEGLANRKVETGCERPWLELHFLMTRSNLKDLPEMVRISAALGANEVVATNLTYTPTLRLDQMRVFDSEPAPEHEAIIAEAHQVAAGHHLPLRVYPLRMGDPLMVCDANPIESVFINHRGDVAPCVYLGLSIERDIPRHFLGTSQPVHPVTFGNVREGFTQVLSGRGRSEFAGAFQKRNICANPLASFALLTSEHAEQEIPPAPLPCRHCYKLFGV